MCMCVRHTHTEREWMRECVCVCVSVLLSIEPTTKDLLWYLNNLINKQRLLVDEVDALKALQLFTMQFYK